MSSKIQKFARNVGANLRSLGMKSLNITDDDGEIWRRFDSLSQTMRGCPGGEDAVSYYKKLAVRTGWLRPVISDAAGRFLSTYRLAVLMPAPQTGVIVDIGAGCGLFSVLASLLHPGKRVWAFEPDAELFEVAEKTVAALGISNLEIRNLAVLPKDWPSAPAYLDIFKDNIFRSIQGEGNVPVTGVKIADLPFGVDTRIAILKVVAPGMFLELTSELLGRTDVLLGEVWKADYAAEDHPLLSPLLDSVSVGCIRDAECGLLYKTAAAQRSTRSLTPWAPAIRPVRADPQISVIIPTYNIGDLIEPCVESIIKSIDRPTEILVINDGSTQAETIQSLERVAKMDYTRVIDKPNGGCASARNLGLQIAQGSFVTLIDGDDFVEDGFLPLLNEAMYVEATNIAEIGFADYSSLTGEISDNSEPYSERAATKGLFGYETNMWSLLRRQPAIWRRMYRTEWLRQNNLYFPERIKAYDDMEFQFISLYLNGGVSYINSRGYFYRKDRPGQDVKASDTRHFGTFQMLVTMENFLRNRRAPRDHFVLFDLFTIDCLSWSYSLLHPQLQAPFLQASRTFLLGGKSLERAVNIHWEIGRNIGSSSSNFARDFCADIPDRRALEVFHHNAANYADHVYDYHYPLEVSV